MPSDLTERLAAKLMPETEFTGETDWLLLYRVTDWLPLLLSEPELVAGLAPEAKREVLRQLLDLALDEHDWGNFHHFRAKLDGALYGEMSNDATARKAIREFLAPSPAPSETR